MWMTQSHSHQTIFLLKLEVSLPQNLWIQNHLIPEWGGGTFKKCSPFLEEMVNRLMEWLPSLSPRKKRGKEKRDLEVGDLVLILSTDKPCGKWPLGRKVQVFPGPDGHVRAADVNLKVKGSILWRPIVKLCPLECEA